MSTFDTRNGGPAFPDPGNTYGRNGMTLRDWFAGQALAGMNAYSGVLFADDGDALITAKTRARSAYAQADAMLAARAAEKEEAA